MNRREYLRNKRNAEYIIRNRVVRKQRIVLLFTFIIAVITASFIISSNAYADNKNNIDDNYTKQYKSVMIYSGDTLDTIAFKYMGDGYSSVNAFINEIKSINNINDYTTLIPGNHIIVPYYECIEETPVVEFKLAVN